MVGIRLKKIFPGIAILITILLILISLASNEMPAVKSETYDDEKSPPFAGWQLTLTGFVENPFNLTWTEFIALPRTTVVAQLVCVDYPNNPMEEGNWTGVQLRTLLEEARLAQNAVKVGFLALDGYSTDLTLEAALQENIILAYENNGLYINDLRLVVPGKWGYKWISQLIRIEVLDYNFLGFWESKGYSDIADITNSEVSQPLPEVNVSPSTPSSLPSTSLTPSASQQPKTSSEPVQPTPTPKTEPAIKAENVLLNETSFVITALAASIVLVAILTIIRKKKIAKETRNKT